MGNLNKQQGVVLVAAMLMILMVSGIAVSVMSGSALDNKMVNATQESYRVENIARGQTERTIKAEIDKGGDSNFLNKMGQNEADLETVLSIDGSKVVMTYTNKNENVPLLPCPPAFAPTTNIKCNYLKLSTTQNYGRANKHTLTLETGITQEMMGEGS